MKTTHNFHLIFVVIYDKRVEITYLKNIIPFFIQKKKNEMAWIVCKIITSIQKSENNTIRKAKQSTVALWFERITTGQKPVCAHLSVADWKPRYCPNSIVQSSSRSGENCSCGRRNRPCASSKSLVAVRRVIFHRWKALFECLIRTPIAKIFAITKKTFSKQSWFDCFSIFSWNGSWDDFQKIVGGGEVVNIDWQREI